MTMTHKALLNGGYHNCRLLEKVTWQEPSATRAMMDTGVTYLTTTMPADTIRVTSYYPSPQMAWVIELENGTRVTVPESVIFEA